jgi:mutator protein MutT
MTPLRVSLAAIHRDGRFFLQRRSAAAKRFPGLWEFPGGKVEAGETPREALVRELREEVDWAPAEAEALPAIRYAYPGLAVEFTPFLCKGDQAPVTGLAWGWFTLAELARLPMPEANRHISTLLGAQMARQ